MRFVSLLTIVLIAFDATGRACPYVIKNIYKAIYSVFNNIHCRLTLVYLATFSNRDSEV